MLKRFRDSCRKPLPHGRGSENGALISEDLLSRARERRPSRQRLSTPRAGRKNKIVDAVVFAGDGSGIFKKGTSVAPLRLVKLRADRLNRHGDHVAFHKFSTCRDKLNADRHGISESHSGRYGRQNLVDSRPTGDGLYGIPWDTDIA